MLCIALKQSLLSTQHDLTKENRVGDCFSYRDVRPCMTLDAAEAHSRDPLLDFCKVRGSFAVIRIVIATAALACLLVACTPSAAPETTADEGRRKTGSETVSLV